MNRVVSGHLHLLLKTKSHKILLKPHKLGVVRVLYPHNLDWHSGGELVPLHDLHQAGVLQAGGHTDPRLKMTEQNGHQLLSFSTRTLLFHYQLIPLSRQIEKDDILFCFSQILNAMNGLI